MNEIRKISEQIIIVFFVYSHKNILTVKKPTPKTE